MNARSPTQIPVGDDIILLAEDNPVLRELTIRQLKKLGLAARPVSSGREVLEAMTRESFALVLMDCKMPDMDGFEATRQIRQREDAIGKHTPIIAMTASAMKGDRDNCLAAGMDDYLSKPVAQTDLKNVIDRWLSSDALETYDANGAVGKGPLLNIERLKETYGAEALGETLSMSVKEIHQLLWQISIAAEKSDMRSVVHAVHQLKGLAAVIGAVDMEQIALEIELDAKNGRADALAQGLARLIISAEALSSFMKGFLNN